MFDTLNRTPVERQARRGQHTWQDVEVRSPRREVNYRTWRWRIRPGPQTPRPSEYRLVELIRRIDVRNRSLDDLRAGVLRLRESVRSGVSPTSEKVLVPTFSLVAEAVRRGIGLGYYDVQLLAGIVLSRGAIAEVLTGEGKTIAAALPAVLHALGGKGVHVLTTNAYLAQRDFQLLRPVYESLGLSVGHLRDGDSVANKATVYNCDIVYGTGYEFGFDYLRDQMARKAGARQPLGSHFRRMLSGTDDTAESSTVQRGHHVAIIDEADSVLLDEATTPLVISGGESGGRSVECYQAANRIAQRLSREKHFVLDQANRRLWLTSNGVATVHEALDQTSPTRGPSRIRHDLRRPWSQYIEQALRARHTIRRDVDYVVRDHKVMIVDQDTGRIFSDRTWRTGLHQAVEAKEGVPLTAEKDTVARITRQRYFRLYKTLCGMTGTARGSEPEFREFYGRPVVTVPSNKPCQRIQLSTRFFSDESSKLDAIVSDVSRRHHSGQPVLIGTRTVEKSNAVLKRLRAEGLPFRLLNGVQDEDEASIVARAGEQSAVTVATNMAGRGTDIRLSDEAARVGGLHVIGVEHHDVRRVDRQLVGRAGRQGDPGSSQFYLSADDELVQRTNSKIAHTIRQSADHNGECRRDLSTHVGKLQRQAERQKHRERRLLVEQDSWIEELMEALG